MRRPCRAGIAWATLLALACAVALSGTLACTSGGAPATRVADAAGTVSGRIALVEDGDSFLLLTDAGAWLHVRLHAVDAPELLQPAGWTARSGLRRLLAQGPVHAGCYKTDARGRAVCRVRAGEIDVGLALVMQGLAWRYRAFETEQTPVERAALAAAEQEARRLRIGLWERADPRAPWAFRDCLRSLRWCG